MAGSDPQLVPLDQIHGGGHGGLVWAVSREEDKV